jgi:hypothetical protein
MMDKAVKVKEQLEFYFRNVVNKINRERQSSLKDVEKNKAEKEIGEEEKKKNRDDDVILKKSKRKRDEDTQNDSLSSSSSSSLSSSSFFFSPLPTFPSPTFLSFQLFVKSLSVSERILRCLLSGLFENVGYLSMLSKTEKGKGGKYNTLQIKQTVQVESSTGKNNTKNIVTPNDSSPSVLNIRKYVTLNQHFALPEHVSLPKKHSPIFSSINKTDPFSTVSVNKEKPDAFFYLSPSFQSSFSSLAIRSKVAFLHPSSALIQV